MVRVSKVRPPSEVLVEAHPKWNGIPENPALLSIAKEVLLPSEEVLFWFKYTLKTSV